MRRYKTTRPEAGTRRQLEESRVGEGSWRSRSEGGGGGVEALRLSGLLEERKLSGTGQHE